MFLGSKDKKIKQKRQSPAINSGAFFVAIQKNYKGPLFENKSLKSMPASSFARFAFSFFKRHIANNAIIHKTKKAAIKGIARIKVSRVKYL
jgi:hypothetical protein